MAPAPPCCTAPRSSRRNTTCRLQASDTFGDRHGLTQHADPGSILIAVCGDPDRRRRLAGLGRSHQTETAQARASAPSTTLVERRLGSKAKAEAELKAREKRVKRFELVPLTSAETARFSQSWTRLQRSFVDDPKGVLIEGDRLVRELLVKRGYPVVDFDLRAADISVDHPIVVDNDRAAQRIVSLDQRGEASTEDLRKAVVHFHALFDELLGIEKTPRDRTAAPTRPAA